MRVSPGDGPRSAPGRLAHRAEAGGQDPHSPGAGDSEEDDVGDLIRGQHPFELGVALRPARSDGEVRLHAAGTDAGGSHPPLAQFVIERAGETSWPNFDAL